jgi:predicted nuclease of predicted toxin-antitoxin system
MKLLLDECIDRKFAREFVDHEMKTVPQMGWAGVKNRQLLALAEAEFDVFITVDRNLIISTEFATVRYCGNCSASTIQSLCRFEAFSSKSFSYFSYGN